MGSNSINIGWNKYETAILIDAYVQVKEGKLLRKDAVAQVSKRLRERMLKIGTTISETYRNENGISMQMSAIGYAMGNEEKDFISSISDTIKTAVIKNPIVTSQCTVDGTIRHFMSLYTSAIAANDKIVDEYIEGIIKKSEATEPELKSILYALLHSRYLNNRNLLSDERLTKLSRKLTDTVYNEDKLAVCLKSLRIDDYTARLLTLLESKTMLTEGFMPIEPSRNPLKQNPMSMPKSKDTKTDQ